MGRLAAVFGVLLGVLLIPLALSGPTAWVLLPAHGLLTLVALLGIGVEGWAGHPGATRLWGVGYLVVTGLVVGALELGAGVRDAGMGYWAAPWLALLMWGWMPPVAASMASVVGGFRRRRLSRGSVRRRKRASARAATAPGTD